MATKMVRTTRTPSAAQRQEILNNADKPVPVSSEPVEPEPVQIGTDKVEGDPNERYRVLAYSLDLGTKRRVYILNVGDTFQGFGGSRHGLTARKTGSLIISYFDHGSRRDVEYNLTDPDAWSNIRSGLARSVGFK
jgi:hypothetical protein